MTPRSNGTSDASGGLSVLYLINQLGPGGAERSLAEMVDPLALHGVRLTVACVKPVRQEYRSATELPCAVHVLGRRGILGNVTVVRRLLRQLRPDVLHTTLFEANLIGRLAAVHTGVPVLTSLVSTDYEPVRFLDPRVPKAKLLVVRQIDRWTSRHLTAGFHAITSAVAESAQRTMGLPPERITVVHRGRDANRLGRPSAERRSRSRRALGLAPDAPVLVTVGRQEFAKGHEHLYRAVALIRERWPNLRLILAGRRGHVSPELDRLHRELALDEHVRWIGVVDEVGDVLAAGDIFVFPSLYEGLGGAVLEAMALGLPVVASDLPALREILEPGGNGLLVPPSRPEELAQAIDRLLADPALREELGRRSRQRFDLCHRVERSAEAMAKLYRRLAGSTTEETP